jgi:hypothetical protein
MDLSLLPWAEGALDEAAFNELVASYNLLPSALSAEQTFEQLDLFVREQREARSKDPLKVAGFLAVMLNVTFLASQSASSRIPLSILHSHQNKPCGPS